MNTTIELIAYDTEFQKSCNTGWGCGYVLIPLEHPFLVKRLLNDDSYFYPQIEDFSEEITFCKEENGLLKIGFDTAHSWNNLENSSKTFVDLKTRELKKCIDSYTILDAKKEVALHFKNLKLTFKKYL